MIKSEPAKSAAGMQVGVHFYSYFRDLAGCAETTEELPSASTVADLVRRLFQRFPRLAPMEQSMLVAVDVEYQDRHYVLKPNDQVSLFPPVQGG